jgi:CRP-like cAMP-binding protein
MNDESETEDEIVSDTKVVKNLPFFEVNSYFGELEILEDKCRRWTVVAKTDCVAYTIPKDKFFDMLK